MSDISEPRWEHNCDYCKFVGRHSYVDTDSMMCMYLDVYLCDRGNTIEIVIRYSSEKSSYWSGSIIKHKHKESSMLNFLEKQGYSYVRKTEKDIWVGIQAQLYTYGLFVGLNEIVYNRRYCYQFYSDVIKAIEKYDGVGDPSGPWIKVKGENDERLGPGAKPGVITEKE